MIIYQNQPVPYKNNIVTANNIICGQHSKQLTLKRKSLSKKNIDFLKSIGLKVKRCVI